MANEIEDDLFINIVEELDEDDNVLDYRLEEIKPNDIGNDLASHEKDGDLSDSKKETGKLSYKKGFLNNYDRDKKTPVTGKFGDVNIIEDYSSTGDELNDLLEDMCIDNRSSKKKNVKESPIKNKETSTITKENESVDQTKMSKEVVNKVQKTEEKIDKPINEVANQESQPQVKSASIDKFQKVKQKKASSLFIPSKRRRPKRVSKKIDDSSSSKTMNSSPPTPVASKNETSSSIPIISKEKHHSDIQILPVDSLPKTISNNLNKPTLKIPEDSSSVAETSELPEGERTQEPESLLIAENNTQPENFRPQIAREDMLELELISEAFVDEDDEIDEKDENGEQLIDDRFYDEEELYQRVFPWIRREETEVTESDKDESMSINGVDLGEDEDNDDDEDFILERPIISESVLNEVKGKLAYEIDNEIMETVGPDEIRNVEYVESFKDSTSSNEILKPILKEEKVDTTIMAEIEENKTKRKAKKSVKFSETAEVKEIEPVSKEIQQKLELDKLYKDVFGGEYELMQKQITENLAQFGKKSPISVDLPDHLKSENSEAGEEEQEEEISFNDIVSNTIVENQVIEDTFVSEDAKSFENKPISGAHANSLSDMDYLTKENTRRNRKNRVSRFKQFTMNNEHM